MALPLVVDPQISRHAKDPRPHVLDLHSVAANAVETQKGLLCDLFGQRLRAAQCTEITEYRLAQFEEPSLDLRPEPDRAGIWRQNTNFLPAENRARAAKTFRSPDSPAGLMRSATLSSWVKAGNTRFGLAYHHLRNRKQTRR